MTNRLTTVEKTVVRTQAELQKALELGGWLVRVAGHELHLTYSVQGEPCVLIASVSRRLIKFVLQAGWAIPRAQRPATALEIAAINASTPFGCLSVDPEDGIVRCAIVSHLPEAGISCQTVFDLIITAASLLHKHWQSILHPCSLPLSAGKSDSLFSRLRLNASDPPMQGTTSENALNTFETIDLIRYRERWLDSAVLRDAGSNQNFGLLSVNASAEKGQGEVVFSDLSGHPASLHHLLVSKRRCRHADFRAYYGRHSRSDALEAALFDAGFTEQYEEVVVRARLDAALPLPSNQVSDEIVWQQDFPLSRKSLDEFLTDSPNRALRLPAEREAIRIAIQQAQVASIGSPPRAFVAVTHDQDSGTILLLAVHPEARRKGLGKQLHAAALLHLYAQGISDYFDMTDIENIAMQRLFFTCGAQLLGSVLVNHAPQKTIQA